MNMSSCPWSSWWQISHHKDELASLVLALSSLILAISWLSWKMKRSRNGSSPPLPPGPRGLPLIGNLPFIEPHLHRYFAKLAENYGPIVKLRLGNKICIVIGSASLAKEVLKDNDITFANRDASAVALAATYNGMDLGWAPYGPQWRMLRKVFVQDMTSNKSISACSGLRRREVRRMVSDLHGMIGSPINIREQMFVTIFNVISSMLWGDSEIPVGKKSGCIGDGAEFRHMITEMIKLFGRPNISDFFPVLARFDIQGLARQVKRYSSWLNRTLDTIIEQRRKEAGEEHVDCSKQRKDFLQLLLDLADQGDPKTPLTDIHIKALFRDIIVAGTDTTWTTIEWAMSEILQNPEVMKRAQEELDQVVGMNRIVEETDLSKFRYLDATVKEVLRLHPAVPLLLPRRPSQSCTISGYMIPKGAKVLTNVWAIHRDPEAWDNPLKFMPERFLSDTHKWDYNGNDYRYFPFGSGRRMCAGVPIAEKMLMYVLATLLHSFEWNLPQKTTLDLSEEFGIVLKKAKPLVAIPKPRLSNPKLYI